MINVGLTLASSPGSLHGFTGNTGGGVARKKEKPGMNCLRMREVNCRKHVRTEGNDADQR